MFFVCRLLMFSISTCDVERGQNLSHSHTPVLAKWKSLCSAHNTNRSRMNDEGQLVARLTLHGFSRKTEKCVCYMCFSERVVMCVLRCMRACISERKRDVRVLPRLRYRHAAAHQNRKCKTLQDFCVNVEKRKLLCYWIAFIPFRYVYRFSWRSRMRCENCRD